MESYTDAYLLVDGAADLMTYSDEYDQLIQSMTDQLEPLGEERAALRAQTVRQEGQGKIDEARMPNRNWRTPNRSWQMPGRNWTTAGRTMPRASWTMRTACRSTGTANRSTRTAWRNTGTEKRNSRTAKRSWNTAGTSCRTESGSTTTPLRSLRRARRSWKPGKLSGKRGSPACGKNCFRRWNSFSREPTCPTTRTMPPCWQDWREVTALSSTVPWTMPGIRSRRGSPPWKPSSGNWPRAIPRRYSSSWTL